MKTTIQPCCLSLALTYAHLAPSTKTQQIFYCCTSTMYSLNTWFYTRTKKLRYANNGMLYTRACVCVCVYHSIHLIGKLPCVSVLRERERELSKAYGCRCLCAVYTRATVYDAYLKIHILFGILIKNAPQKMCSMSRLTSNGISYFDAQY